ncbi:MAG TPA: type ISP restriction/modification enzyme, partial [Streptomyces sp.]|nr:type ISP restriction/modification enzyme [Streptomyces sp.]
HGPYDQQWLIPDQRLIDAARPQLWRVSDERQTHLVETAHDPRRPGPLLAFTTLLPDGDSPAGRPGRIRPLHRRPGGREPNILPGLTAHLASRLGVPVEAEDVLAWIAVVVCAGPNGRAVPLTSDCGLWQRGVGLGRRLVWLHTRGARCGEGRSGSRPRLPGGRRPYVRAALPARPGPGDLAYEPEERSLYIGEGRVAPVEKVAWEFEAGGSGVLESWFAQRTEPAEPGTLAAVRGSHWPQEWTSELLELITVLTLLDELRLEQRELTEGLRKPQKQEEAGAVIGRAELESAGMLPPPPAACRPASVLDLREEGPGGQLALL